MTLNVSKAIECVQLLKNYTVLVHVAPDRIVNLRNWAQKSGLIPIDITAISLNEQKVIFRTIHPFPSQYLLYYIHIPTSKLYTRLKSLILFEVEDNPDHSEIVTLKDDISCVLIVSSIKTYVYDLIVQLRYNRFLHSGVPTYLLEMMHNYLRYLAICDNIDYVLPSMVETAFMNIIPFQIRDLLIKDASEELTMLYGSDAKLVNEVRGIINEYDVMLIVLEQVPHI